MIQLFCRCIFVLYIGTTAFAQDCQFSFKGKITDFHNNSPIIGASLHIENSNTYTTSDFEGNFEFKNLCAEEIVVKIKHIACKTKRITVAIKENVYKEFF